MAMANILAYYNMAKITDVNSIIVPAEILAWTNTLAYCKRSLITAVKSFI